MSIQLFIAISALIAGLICFVSPNHVRFACGGWLILAGVLWLVGGFAK